MGRIRVLIVDDSVVLRRLLSECLSSDPELEVVGTASDGKIGLARIDQLNPDIVILDLEMPVLDGLETLAEIRKSQRKVPVIVFSTLTERGAVATLNALNLGASDYMTKSSQVKVAGEHVFAGLVPKIKALCRRQVKASPLSPISDKAASTISRTGGVLLSGCAEVVTIGVSTGGPNALAALFGGLSKDITVPILIVQHMPPMFTHLLAVRLSSDSGLRVREGIAGELVRPGDVWIAPGGRHMDVEKTSDGVRLRLHDAPPENSCRPAVDVLFRSVAEVYGPAALAVVMTGMGQDGLRGCESICEKGGRIIIQDEASSVVWGMPGAVSQAGLAQKTLPLDKLAEEINRLARKDPKVAAHKTLPGKTAAELLPQVV